MAEQEQEQEEQTRDQQDGQDGGDGGEEKSERERAQEVAEEYEQGQQKMEELEEDPPQNLEDWPTDRAKYTTFGGGEGDHGYDEGPERNLGPSGVRHHEDGTVEVDGEEVDNPEEFKGDPIPGGPTDPDSPSMAGEEKKGEAAEQEKDDDDSDDDSDSNGQPKGQSKSDSDSDSDADDESDSEQDDDGDD